MKLFRAFVIGWFRSTSPWLAFDLVRFHYATMTRLICAPSPFGFSIAHICHRLHCVHLPKYHRVVSINRPSGYEPDALPLRHDDFICPTLSHKSPSSNILTSHSPHPYYIYNMSLSGLYYIIYTLF